MSETFPRSLTPEDLGKRVLVQTIATPEVYYMRVQELSPSGRFVHLVSTSGSLGWMATDQVTLLEVLPEKTRNHG